MKNLDIILKNKNIPSCVKDIIYLIYPIALEYWGEQNEKLILDTIKEFQIFFVNDLAMFINNIFDNKISERFMNVKGLCTVVPYLKYGAIDYTKNIIILDNTKSLYELAKLVTHELFLHAVKSIKQPYLSSNTIMIGLKKTHYTVDKNDKIKEVNYGAGFALEELSTYYAQEKILPGSIISKTSPQLCNLILSLGKILDETLLGKLIKEAQLSKNTDLIERKFYSVICDAKKINNIIKNITWNEYNQILDYFLNLHYKIYNSSYDLHLVEEYNYILKKLIELNSYIVLADSIAKSSEKYINRDQLVFSIH